MKKKYKTLIVNNGIKLTKRSHGDQISTVSTKELGIVAPQGSSWKAGLFGGVDIQLYSNRKDGTSLTVQNKFLPRFQNLPEVGDPAYIRIFGLTRLY